MAGVRLAGRKLMLRPVDGWVQLYDLRRDPAELQDLSGEQPGLVAEYRALLEAWLAGAKAATAGEAPVDPAMLHRSGPWDTCSRDLGVAIPIISRSTATGA